MTRSDPKGQKYNNFSMNEQGDSEDAFPLLTLAPEIMFCVLSTFTQNQVLKLRLVNHKLKNLVDELYGFRFIIYDEPERLNGIRKLKCEKITVWKLIVPLESHLFDFPSYLKIIEINGPVTELNLQKLISPCINLEKFSIIRRANYPWILNLRDTPSLANLKKLKILLLNCEESKGSRSETVRLPLMDCHFPSLSTLDIVKGFHIRQYSSYVGSILKFVSRHYKTLQILRMCVLARRNLCFFPPDNMDLELVDLSRLQSLQHQNNKRLSSVEIELENICKICVMRLCITTQGYKEDIKIWAGILENQSKLVEFRFDWTRIDSSENSLTSSYPWTIFKTPILKSCETLTTVELNNLSVFLDESGDGKRFVPITLSIFSCCKRLEYLALSNDEGSTNEQDDVTLNLEENQSVIVSGMDLPSSLLTIRLEGLPTKSTELQAIVHKCENLQCITFKDLGATHDLGISSSVIKCMSKLQLLKNLELVSFNTSTPEKQQAMQEVFQAMEIPYVGKDTWLRVSNEPVPAAEMLKKLVRS